jgi:hypothetical protein
LTLKPMVTDPIPGRVTRSYYSLGAG